MNNHTEYGQAPGYAQIDRRDGRLFFQCGDNDRVAIATSIERLIDMLDVMDGDCDLEESGDFEPLLGAPERHPHIDGRWARDRRVDVSQDKWALGKGDQGEEFSAGGIAGGWEKGVSENVDDEDGHDAEDDKSDAEPELGWTDGVNQADANRCWQNEETDLAFCGNGTGWQEHEPELETDDEREADPAECGIADSDGMNELGLGGYPSAMLLKFQSDGTDSAVEMLRAAGLMMHQAEAWSPVCEPGTLFLRIVRN